MTILPFNFALFIAVLLLLFTNPHPCLSKCPPHESEALLSFRAAFSSSPYSSLSSWGNGSDCCAWFNISCHKHMDRVSTIYLSGNAMQGGVISDSVCNLHFLKSLTMRMQYAGNGKGLKGTIPACLGNLSYLQHLDLSYNSLSGTLPPSLGKLSLLQNLDLSWNSLTGTLPPHLGNMSYLQELRLESNMLSGVIPPFICLFTNLSLFTVDNNKLNGTIPSCLGNLRFLEYLDVSSNQLSGTLPFSFSKLSSLTYLYAQGNAFSESVPSNLALPSSIEELSLSLSHHQTISETLFRNLDKLSYFSLSNCVLNISTTWIPLFQLHELYLASCNIDGQIPPWISTQYSLYELTLLDNNLVGEIPSWLWHFSPNLLYLNLSQNYLQGSIFPNTSNNLKVFDVSKNALNGYIPSVWPPSLELLMLNDNLLTGNIPPGLSNLTDLRYLNLANNSLNGVIPPSLGNIAILNLGDNSLEGSIPWGLCPLSFSVNKNKLSGRFPGSIINCTELQTLDMGHNSFTGQIPNSIGNLSELQVLVMKNNYFTGTIPLEIGKLKQLQILDVSSNNLSGFIPQSIVSLQAITVARKDTILGTSIPVVERRFHRVTVVLYLRSLHVGVDVTSKGTYRHYPYILSTLSLIDLSNNQLNGVVPSDFGKLKGLKSLNLSMNNFRGLIPSSLGEMKDLESLDLSRNMFSGNIPEELTSLKLFGIFKFVQQQSLWHDTTRRTHVHIYRVIIFAKSEFIRMSTSKGLLLATICTSSCF